MTVFDKKQPTQCAGVFLIINHLTISLILFLFFYSHNTIPLFLSLCITYNCSCAVNPFCLTTVVFMLTDATLCYQHWNLYLTGLTLCYLTLHIIQK